MQLGNIENLFERFECVSEELKEIQKLKFNI